MYLCLKLWYYKQHNEYPGMAQQVAALEEDRSNLTIGHINNVVDMYWKGRYKYLPNLDTNKRRSLLNNIQMLTKLHAQSIRDGMNKFLKAEQLIVEDEEKAVLRRNITQSKEFMEGLRQLNEAVESTKGQTWLKLQVESQNKGSTELEKVDSPKKQRYHYRGNLDKQPKKRKLVTDNDNTSARSTITSDENRSKQSRKMEETDDMEEEWGVEKEIHDTYEDSNIPPMEILKKGNSEPNNNNNEQVITENQQLQPESSTAPRYQENVEGESSTAPLIASKKNERIMIVEKQTKEALTLAWQLLSNNSNVEYAVKDFNEDDAEEEVDDKEDDEDDEIKEVNALKKKFRKYKEDFQKLEEAAEAKKQEMKKKKRDSTCK